MRNWRGTAVIAVVLVLTIAGAPLARSVGAAGCRSCPPGCPMHKPGKLPCHKTPGTTESHHRGCGSQGAGLAAPGCGGEHEVRGVALPPAVLPPPIVSWPGPVEGPHRVREATLTVRGTDPPETPPPIARA